MNNIIDLLNFKDNIEISGLTEELNVIYIYNKYLKSLKNILVVTNTLYETNKLYESLMTYTSNALIFPMDDFLTSVALAISPDLKIKRLETLNKLQSKDRYIIITNLTGYLRYLPNYKTQSFKIILSTNLLFKRNDLINKLDLFGYEKDSIVTKTGTYAVRGFVIDIYPLEYTHPIRVEYFGDQIESIRSFDENTQLSLEKTNNVEINPYVEVLTKNNSSLYELAFFPHTIFYDYNQIKFGYKKLYDEIVDFSKNDNKDIHSYMYYFDEINPSSTTIINYLDDDNKKSIKYNSKEIDSFNMNLDLVKIFVEKNIFLNKTVVFCLSKSSEVKEIKKLFDKVFCEKEIKKNQINIINQEINKGFIIDNYVVISEYDIESPQNKKIFYQNNFKVGKKIKGFDDLKKGDYVVHRSHGIGIYNGVVVLTKNGLQKDYIQLLYKDNDKIYLPVEKIDTLFKYNSKEGSNPKVTKLGSLSWEKTKSNVRKKIKNITKELIKLYSERETINGPVFKYDVEMDLFKNEFPYEETLDQEKSITEVLKDLSLKKPMDRLLCGDVGFGKTEVAFRAAFKTILNGYQVAYLCPTTILSKQHYNNSINRFKNHAVNINILNRFSSKKDVKRTLKNVSDGTTDILIGTHRILSNDVKFKKLGLLIIDEEQRFGVTHKEKIKQLKTDVNVLTLSATPIPRTLKFALSGLRDLSLIDTAPVNRYPIQTYVIKENEMLIKEAIYKELARKGQVFILFNNVEKIEKKKIELEKLIPSLRIKIAHGQMGKLELENIMNEFINNEFDVLLCTTIIETGIDIPNVNTLIIYNSDRFGLSQLYQIRGRVGRSDKIAYAYLMYEENKTLNNLAVKRLQAIKEFTELGSGYKIAMRDLALRGAGDLLGGEQAGFVEAVGMDLYLKMIEEEVNDKSEEENFQSDNSLVEVETHISDKYVSDEAIKIEIHKLINSIDSYSKLQEVKEEIEDRFGKINDLILIYMYEEWFEKIATKLELKRINKTNNLIEFEISENISQKIKGDKMFLIANNLTPNFKFKYKNNKIHVILLLNNLKMHYIFYLTKLFSEI